MQTTIVLRTKPNRMGNTKKLVIYIDQNRILAVTDSPGGLRGACLEVKVAPSEITSLIAISKRNGLYHE